jgi:hypothetical protein
MSRALQIIEVLKEGEEGQREVTKGKDCSYTMVKAAGSCFSDMIFWQREKQLLPPRLS